LCKSDFDRNALRRSACNESRAARARGSIADLARFFNALAPRRPDGSCWIIVGRELFRRYVFSCGQYGKGSPLSLLTAPVPRRLDAHPISPISRSDPLRCEGKPKWRCFEFGK
jgi:hypothetical protein